MDRDDVDAGPDGLYVTETKNSVITHEIKKKLLLSHHRIISKLEKVALDGYVECCAPPPQWCDLEL